MHPVNFTWLSLFTWLSSLSIQSISFSCPSLPRTTLTFRSLTWLKISYISATLTLLLELFLQPGTYASSVLAATFNIVLASDSSISPFPPGSLACRNNRRTALKAQVDAVRLMSRLALAKHDQGGDYIGESHGSSWITYWQWKVMIIIVHITYYIWNISIKTSVGIPKWCRYVYAHVRYALFQHFINHSTLLSCQETVITTSGLAGYWKPLVGSQRVCSTGSKCRASHSSWQKPPVTLEPWPWETSRCVQQFGDKGCSREWNAPIGIKHLDSLKFPVSMPRLAKAEVLCRKDQHSKLCPIGSNYWLSSCDTIIITIIIIK